jgi:Restriction Enzyme Adenine Methylase Associated
VPLFEIDSTGELIPFRRLTGGANLYETQIEDLAWANPEEITGESLFLVRRQAPLGHGGIPDIVALDRDARVIVIEVKREFERQQLAQCLEYAGWARKTNLDELAQMYRFGADRFFADWQEFTGSEVPAIVNQSSRLILLAGSFHDRTAAAIDFLIENRVPVKVVPISIYEDQQGRKFVDIEAEHEPEFAAGTGEQPQAIDHTKIHGHRVRLTDLLEYELLLPGDELYWDRPQLGNRYEAAVTETGAIRLSDGRVFSSPSRAGMEAAGIASLDGWYAWRVARRDGALLNELRHELAASVAATGRADTANGHAGPPSATA